MRNHGNFALRLVAVGMVLAAVAWGAATVRLTSQADDGGPPLGALCMAVPSVVLLVAAGAVGLLRSKR